MKLSATKLVALVLAPLWVQTPITSQDKLGDKAQARLQELQTEQRQLMTDWQTKMREAAKAAEEAKKSGEKSGPIPAMPMRPDMTGLRTKFLAAAKDFQGEDAVAFLIPAMQLGAKPADAQEVLQTLLDNHLQSPKLASLGGMFGNLDRMTSPEFAKMAFEKIENESKDQNLIGWVSLARNNPILRKAAVGSTEFDKAKSQLLAATERATDKRLTQQVKSLIDEFEKFAVGLVSPDIEGEDLDGVAFKLSDYGGKVIFLDFWGDW